jgi:hypothetical protein
VSKQRLLNMMFDKILGSLNVFVNELKSRRGAILTHDPRYCAAPKM